MSRYIRCYYCGDILGEIGDDEEIPTSAYHKDCHEEWGKKDPMDELYKLI